MNLYQIHRGLAGLIAGLENGMIEAPAIDLDGLRLTHARLLALAMLPQIDGNTTADDLLRLDENEAWQDAALAMIRQTRPGATYVDLPDLEQAARGMRSAEKWIAVAVDRDGIRVADYA